MIIPAGVAFNNFVVVAVIVATLYFAREILVPIALAVLLSFVLAPLVKLFQRVRIPRPVAVLLAVVAALAVAISLGTMVMLQVNQLVSDLPRYQRRWAKNSRFAGHTRSKWRPERGIQCFEGP
jgi:predicted PurR-regulated permease PerM